MSLTVNYYDIPVGAQENAEITCENGQQVNSGDSAYWRSNSASDASGSFEAPMVMTLSFPESHSATGLTFYFWESDGLWCAEVKVSWYNSLALIAESVVHPDSAVWVLPQAVKSFNRIRVEFLAVNLPWKNAIVKQIQVGQVISFGRKELTKVQLVNEVDPTLCSLPVDTMRVEIFDKNAREFLPQENQKMELVKDGKCIAKQYISGSNRASRHNYTFTCQSAVGLLKDDFMGGIYSDAPIEGLVESILDGRSFAIDPAFSGRTVTGYLPICSRREALQQIAFALGAMVTTQGGDVIRLVPLPTSISGSFDPNSIFVGSKAETSQRIARFEVVAHKYTPSPNVETILDQEPLTGTDILLTFQNPYCEYNITGGRIVDSGANFVRIAANGNVTLTAKTFIHTQVTYTAVDAAATSADRNNVLVVDSATLIHSGNVQSVLERLRKIKQLRQTLNHEVAVSGQLAGDKVSSVNPWGTQIRGYIASMDSTLTQNGHTAAVKIIGEEVAPEGVYHYAGEIYAGGTEILY